MERVISVEEKIRRAEEIYQRRKQGEIRPIAKVTVNEKKDIKLLKKMIIQILICVGIYLLIYTIQNNEYIFSEDFINKVKTENQDNDSENNEPDNQNQEENIIQTEDLGMRRSN